MYHRIDGIKFNIDAERCIGNFNWPAGSLRDNPQRWPELGITEHPEEVIPDANLNHVVENPDGTYTATPKTAEELAAELAAEKSRVLLHIDADVDEIYRLVVGNRTTEYQLARDQAAAYVAAGYAGAVPATVQEWANINMQTSAWAADNILAQAAAWIAAQLAIRGHRLTTKSQVRAATTLAEVQSAYAAFEAFEVYIKGQLGI